MHLPETAIHTEHKAIFERTYYLYTIDRDRYENATSLKTAKTCQGFLLKEYSIMFSVVKLYVLFSTESKYCFTISTSLFP